MGKISDMVEKLSKHFNNKPPSNLKNQDPGQSPLQRFKRLENELEVLKQDLKTMEKAVANGEDKPVDFDPSTLVDEIAKLQTQINSLHLQSIGSGKNASDFDSKAKK